MEGSDTTDPQVGVYLEVAVSVATHIPSVIPSQVQWWLNNAEELPLQFSIGRLPCGCSQCYYPQPVGNSIPGAVVAREINIG